jgi:hypothetical protein
VAEGVMHGCGVAATMHEAPAPPAAKAAGRRVVLPGGRPAGPTLASAAARARAAPPRHGQPSRLCCSS